MKEITPIDHPAWNLISPSGSQEKSEHPSVSFGKMFKDYLQDVQSSQLKANQAIDDLASGRNTDIHNTMIAMEKASISFKLLMETRNKILSAYETIMRMQV